MKELMIVAACACIDRDGRVLLARRPADKVHGGLWEFPGGKLEPGETPESALVRELKEELTIDVTEACLAPFGFVSRPLDPLHLLLTLFVCRKWRGAPTPVEAPELAWARARNLLSYDLAPADRPLAAQLRDFLEPT